MDEENEKFDNKEYCEWNKRRFALCACPLLRWCYYVGVSRKKNYIIKIETPGHVSIFLVNGEKKKNSESPLLSSQFELFTSSVEPTNECGICPSYYACIGTPEVINLTVFFPRFRPVFIYFFTNYSCFSATAHPFLPTLFRTIYTFFFTQGV